MTVMEVKYMEIFGDEDNKLTYCAEVTTSKSLNKFTDKIKIFHHKYLTGENYFDFCFGRTYKGKLLESKFYLFKENLRLYIYFLKNFYEVLKITVNKESNIVHYFFIKDQGEISIGLLGDSYVKLTAVDKKHTKVFYILNKDELFYYITVIENIYYERNLTKVLNCPKGFVDKVNKNQDKNQYTLSQKDKNNVYLSALYAFVDEALDRKDEEAFYAICGQIKKYCKE